MLVIVQFICVFLVCAENHFGSNTFLAITFLLPIMVILYMVHGSSYSIKTGALNADSLNEYLNQQASIQISTYYMCLRFDTDSEYVMPDELGKLFLKTDSSSTHLQIFLFLQLMSVTSGMQIKSHRI
jgi:hypothetical protein